MEAPANHPALLGALLMQQSQTRLLKLCLWVHWPCPVQGIWQWTPALLRLTWTQLAWENRERHWKYCTGLDHRKRINMPCSSSNWKKRRSGKQEKKQVSSYTPFTTKKKSTLCVREDLASQHYTLQHTCYLLKVAVANWNWALIYCNLGCLFPLIHLMTENTEMSACSFPSIHQLSRHLPHHYTYPMAVC